MPRITGIQFALAAAIVGLCGCSRAVDVTVAQEPLRFSDVIVDIDWLSQHRTDPRLVILDAREPGEYEAGHIDGAVNLPKSLLLDASVKSGNKLASVNLIQRVLGEAGVDALRAVVIYDGKNFRDAARVFWVLEVHGHPSVAVLNGGLGKWTEAGLPITTTATKPTPRAFIANVRPERIATKLGVLRAIEEGGTVILDARSSQEFQGLKSEANRKGHIPKARNVEFTHNLVFDKDGACSVRFSNELVDLYRHELVDRSKVICYCNSGNRASVSYLALRSIGYDAAVYEGSWLEWGNDPELPVEQSLE